jgi:hypothetical protein
MNFYLWETFAYHLTHTKWEERLHFLVWLKQNSFCLSAMPFCLLVWLVCLFISERLWESCLSPIAYPSAYTKWVEYTYKNSSSNSRTCACIYISLHPTLSLALKQSITARAHMHIGVHHKGTCIHTSKHWYSVQKRQNVKMYSTSSGVALHA